MLAPKEGMVQRTGFEPAKHYALGPHPSPFDHSGTSALSNSEPPGVFQNGEAAESEVQVVLLRQWWRLTRLRVIVQGGAVHRLTGGEEQHTEAYADEHQGER